MTITQEFPRTNAQADVPANVILTVSLEGSNHSLTIVMRWQATGGLDLAQRWVVPPGGLTAGMLDEIGARSDERTCYAVLAALGMQGDIFTHLLEERDPGEPFV
jgi:hypothetical protein